MLLTGQVGIDQILGSIATGADDDVLALILFGDHWRDVGLKASSAAAYDQDPESRMSIANAAMVSLTQWNWKQPKKMSCSLQRQDCTVHLQAAQSTIWVFKDRWQC